MEELHVRVEGTRLELPSAHRQLCSEHDAVLVTGTSEGDTVNEGVPRSVAVQADPVQPVEQCLSH